MSRHFARFLMSLGMAVLPVFGQTPASCNASFTACTIPEGVPLQLPFLAISGDVFLLPNLNASLAAVKDVYRIFNDFVDTGAGTGLGSNVFLFSGHNGTLPNPSTYSDNAVPFRRQPTGATDYIGNGTDYALLTKGTPPVGAGSKSSAPTKSALLDLADGPVAVSTTSQTLSAQVPDQDPGQPDGLAFSTANYTSLGGTQLPFNIVGTNPANGATSTTIPTVIVPLKFVYQTAAGLTLDGTNVVPEVQNSPIFLTADYTVGGTDLGVTQFGDAVQRAEFWNFPGFSTNYHVLLGTPAIAPTVTITITTASQGNLFRLRNGGLLGTVAQGVFEPILNSLIRAYGSNTLPIFLSDNVFESADGTLNTCCVLGFHTSQGPPKQTAKTWIYSAFTELGTFRGDVILDVQPLSHEVAEWLNDPFLFIVPTKPLGNVNIIPPAVLPGQGGVCIINFETGDPLEAPPVVFTKTTNSTVYHLQDEVFLPWYLHTVPSFSVNGWYTLLNTFTNFSTLCTPG